MIQLSCLRVSALLTFAALQLVTLGFASAHVEAVIGDQDLKQNPNLPGFIPTSSTEEVLISRKPYVISYNKSRREPNWVAWKVDESDLGTNGRTNDFQPDPDLQIYLRGVPQAKPAVEATDYRGSCFDRGHQSPSGDHTSSEEDNRATFLMSNMLPQTPFLNRVIWEHLESHTRNLVKNEDKRVYVISGPIYDQDFGAIGPKHDIPVPSKNFKVIFVVDANETAKDINSSTPVISVIMPNSLSDGSAPTDHASLCGDHLPVSVDDTSDWEKYQVPLSQVENLAGIKLH